MSSSWARCGFFLGYAAIAAGVAGLGVGLPEVEPWPVLLSAAGFVLALACVDRAGVSLLLLFLLALGLRVPAFVRGPVLSDDVERYVWEGELVLRGVDPWAHAPNAPELEAVRREFAGLQVNHPEVPAIYPPLAQAGHAAVVWLARAFPGDRVANARVAVRLLYLAADLAVFLLLARLCRLRARPPGFAIVWGFCPILAFEFAGSGHLDALAILFLVGALVLRAERRAELGASALLAFSVLVKFLPIVALPAWLRTSPSRWRSGLLLAAVLLLGLAPLAVSRGGFAGLSEYGARWEGFNLGFRWIAQGVELVSGDGVTPEELRLRARRVAGALWLACVILAWFRTRDVADFLRVAIAAFLVLTPILHPWYLAWVLPLVALRLDLEWVWLAVAAPLVYAPLAAGRAHGDWAEPAWLWPVVALPFLALLLFRLARGRGRAFDSEVDKPSCAAR